MLPGVLSHPSMSVFPSSLVEEESDVTPAVVPSSAQVIAKSGTPGHTGGALTQTLKFGSSLDDVLPADVAPSIP